MADLWPSPEEILGHGPGNSAPTQPAKQAAPAVTSSLWPDPVKVLGHAPTPAAKQEVVPAPVQPSQPPKTTAQKASGVLGKIQKITTTPLDLTSKLFGAVFSGIGTGLEAGEKAIQVPGRVIANGESIGTAYKNAPTLGQHVSSAISQIADSKHAEENLINSYQKGQNNYLALIQSALPGFSEDLIDKLVAPSFIAAGVGTELATKTGTLKVSPEQVRSALNNPDYELPPAVRTELSKYADTGFEQTTQRPAGGIREAVGKYVLGGDSQRSTSIIPGEAGPGTSLVGAETPQMPSIRQQLGAPEPVPGGAVTSTIPGIGATTATTVRGQLGLPDVGSNIPAAQTNIKEQLQPTPQNNDQSVTLQSSPIPGLSEFIEKDVKPNAEAFSKGLVETLKLARDTIAPRLGADSKAVDTFMEAKGDRDKYLYLQTQALAKSEHVFDRMSEPERIGVITRIQRGEAQPTPELQAFADWYRKIDDEIHAELVKEGLDVSYKENHFRNLWSVIPGAPPQGMKERFFGTKRFGGTAGFLKKSVLPDVQAGLNMGGKLVTTNPARLANLAWTDAHAYIFAKRMLRQLRDQGRLKIIKMGKQPEAGWARVSSEVSNKFYKGLNVVAEEGVARLLSNMLSKDMIREIAFGRGLFIAKNIYTSIELGLSGFHAIFVTLDSASSNLSLGILKIFNLGIKNAVAGIYHQSTSQIMEGIKYFAEGTKDIVMSPFAAGTNARLGSAAVKSIAGKPDIMKGKNLEAARKEFEVSAMGKRLAKQFPEYKHLVDLLFDGGLKPKMDEAYRTNTIKSFTEAVTSGNYIGGMLRAVPALNKTIMTPLFEIYIPNLKWGAAMKMLSYRLAEEAPRMAKGLITESEIARDVVNSIENRLGEMNFDNLFWDKTFKSSMQLLFRSVTWTGGTVREIGLAPYQQAREFYNAYKEGRSPNLTPKMAYIMALLIITATTSEIIQQLTIGENISSLKDIAYPRIDKLGNRVSIPTYVKDLVALGTKPTETMRNKISGLWGKVIEDMQNKDFYGNEIYSDHDPLWLKFVKSAWHTKPVPFPIQSALNQPTNAEKVESFAGLTKAPRYIENSAIQNEIYDLYNKRFGGGTSSPLEAKKKDVSKQYKQALQAGKTKEAQDIKAQAIADGLYTERGFGRIETNLKTGTDKVLFARLPQDDKDYLLAKMTDQEKAYYMSKSSGRSRGTQDRSKPSR